MLHHRVPPDLAVSLYPLIAAVLYAFGAMLFKRSSDLGVGLWRTTFIANIIAAAFFSGLWLLGGPPVDRDLLWQPAVISLCLFVGQISQFLALEKGDVSVAVPVFGLKVVLVAFLTPFLTDDAVSTRVWVAAVLSVLGVTLLNKKDRNMPPRGVGITLIAGGIGCVCFAIFDILVQRWGPAWGGAGRLLPFIFWINLLFSFGLIFRFSAPLRAIPRAGWSWLIGGCVLLSIQSIIFVSTLAIYGKAASANVMYASRGLISVILVWVIGHWFMNAEQNLGPKVLRWRLFGALLMLSAIVLVVAK
jgi:drug/metabolite transporter (DMT)-like permease